MTEPSYFADRFRACAAVHEAGHAATGIKLGLHVLGISLEGGDPGGSKCFTGFDPPAYELMRKFPELAGPMALAGTQAEKIILEWHVVDGYTKDLEVIWSAYGRRSQEEREAILGPWVIRAQELVYECRPAIETIANRLLTVSLLRRQEILELYERAKTSPDALPAWTRESPPADRSTP